MRAILGLLLLTSAALSGCGGAVQVLTVTGVNPTTVPAGTATMLTVTGKQFTPGMSVVLGTVALATTVTSSTSLAATVPATLAGGVYAVGVRDGGNAYAAPAVYTSTLSVSLTNPVPSVGSVSPSVFLSGAPGATATVTGTGFVTGTTATIDGSARTVTVQDATHLLVALNADDLLFATSRQLVVANPLPGGGTTSGASLTITDYAKNASSYHAYGDSITYGFGVLPDLPFPYTLAAANNLTIADYGQTGDQACDTFQHLYTTRDEYTPSTGRVYSYMIGTNETYFKGVGAYEAVYNSCDQAVLSWLALPRANKLVAGDAALTVTGGCSATPDGSRFGALFCTGAGAISAPLQTAGSPVYVWYYVDDAAPAAATLQVAIDGGSAVSLPTQLTPAIATLNMGTRSIALARLPVAAGVHTVVMTAPGGNAGVLGLGTVPASRASLSFVVAADVPNQSQYPRAAVATQVQYAADARANVALLQSDGLDLRFAETRIFMLGTAAEMADQIHPNQLGHSHLQAAFQTGFTNVNSSTGPRAALRTSGELPAGAILLLQPETDGVVYRLPGHAGALVTLANTSAGGHAATILPAAGEVIDGQADGLLMAPGQVVSLARRSTRHWLLLQTAHAAATPARALDR